MQTTDTDLLERLAPLRELEPTEEEIARLLAAADELRAPRRALRRPARAVALVAATAAVIGALAALPGGKDSTSPKDAHGILQAAAAVAADQPAPLAYRYTRVLDRLVNAVNAGAEHGRVTYDQTSENWTSDGFRGRTIAARGTETWDAPPSPALRRAAGVGYLPTAYDGDFRYGDGPLAEVPFAQLPTDPEALGRLLDAAIRDLRWAPRPGDRVPNDYPEHPRWAPGYPKQWQVDEEVIHSAVLLLSLGNLTSDQREAAFQLLASRPGARSLGEVTDAIGRRGLGVELGGLRVIIDPDTSDILQTSQVSGPPPGEPPATPGTARKPPWPPPASLAERDEVFLSTGSVAALGDRP
jgi:hypothetical protein